MKKRIINYGGLLLFYSVIIIGILLLNLRFSYLNQVDTNNSNDNYMAINK